MSLYQLPEGVLSEYMSTGVFPVQMKRLIALILRTCTYHDNKYDWLMVRSPLADGPGVAIEGDRVRVRTPSDAAEVLESLTLPFETPAVAGLGDLERLPTEVVTLILPYLDLCSYFRLRHVNRKARLLCTTLKDYRLLPRHAFDAWRSLLRTGVAQNSTLMDLWHVLVTSPCGICGHFGPYLFLPTLTRCCLCCIKNDRTALRMVSLKRLCNLTSESEERLLALLEAPLRTVDGDYGLFETETRPKWLWVESQALETVRSLGLCAPDKTLPRKSSSWHEQGIRMATTPFPWLNKETTPFSWLNTEANVIETGLSCEACRGVTDFARRRRYPGSIYKKRPFTRDGFLTHYVDCVYAQELSDRARRLEERTSMRLRGDGTVPGPSDGDGVVASIETGLGNIVHKQAAEVVRDGNRTWVYEP